MDRNHQPKQALPSLPFCFLQVFVTVMKVLTAHIGQTHLVHIQHMFNMMIAFDTEKKLGNFQLQSHIVDNATETY